MFAFCVGATILIGVLGIVFKGSASPTEASAAIRNALIDLLKFICGGVFGIVATLLSTKKDKDGNIIKMGKESHPAYADFCPGPIAMPDPVEEEKKQNKQ